MKSEWEWAETAGAGSDSIDEWLYRWLPILFRATGPLPIYRLPGEWYQALKRCLGSKAIIGSNGGIMMNVTYVGTEHRVEILPYNSICCVCGGQNPPHE